MRHHAFWPVFFRQFPSVDLFFLSCCAYIFVLFKIKVTRNIYVLFCLFHDLVSLNWCQSTFCAKFYDFSVTLPFPRHPYLFNYCITFHKSLKCYVIIIKFSSKIHEYLNKTSMLLINWDFLDCSLHVNVNKLSVFNIVPPYPSLWC